MHFFFLEPYHAMTCGTIKIDIDNSWLIKTITPNPLIRNHHWLKLRLKTLIYGLIRKIRQLELQISRCDIYSLKNGRFLVQTLEVEFCRICYLLLAWWWLNFGRYIWPHSHLKPFDVQRSVSSCQLKGGIFRHSSGSLRWHPIPQSEGPQNPKKREQI